MTAPDWLPAKVRNAVTVYPDRLSWLTARTRIMHERYAIGSTGIAAVLGVSTFSDPWSTWATHHGPDATPRDVLLSWTDEQWRELVAAKEAERGRNAEDLDRGNHFEDPIRTWTADKYQAQWAPYMTVQHPDHPWLVVSPDGFALWIDGFARHSGMGDGCVPCGQEIKTARYSDGWGKDGDVVEKGPRTTGVNAWRFMVPRYYLTQCYAFLACTGLPWWDITVGIAFHDIRTIRVLADPVYQRWMVERVAAWRERHLVNGIQPDVDGSKACADYLRTIPREGDGRPATHEEADLIAEHLRAKAERKEADQLRALAANKIAQSMGTHRRVWVEETNMSATIDARGTVRTKGDHE